MEFLNHVPIKMRTRIPKMNNTKTVSRKYEASNATQACREFKCVKPIGASPGTGRHIKKVMGFHGVHDQTTGSARGG